LPISQNTALFSLLGTQYGGNGNKQLCPAELAGDVASACREMAQG